MNENVRDLRIKKGKNYLPWIGIEHKKNIKELQGKKKAGKIISLGSTYILSESHSSHCSKCVYPPPQQQQKKKHQWSELSIGVGEASGKKRKYALNELQ